MNPKLQQMQQMAKQLKSMGNPQAMINQMAMSNPKFGGFMNMIKNGTNPKDLFYSQAKQMGVDPEQIVSMLK